MRLLIYYYIYISISSDLQDTKNIHIADVANIQNILFNNTDKYYITNWTVPGGINNTTGAAGGSNSAKRARNSSFLNFSNNTPPYIIKFDNTLYNINVFGYNADSEYIKSYTDGTFVGDSVFVYNSDGVVKIRIAVKRIDNADMNNDSNDPNSDINLIPASIYMQQMIDDSFTSIAPPSGYAIKQQIDDINTKVSILRNDVIDYLKINEYVPEYNFYYGEALISSNGGSTNPETTPNPKYCITGYKHNGDYNRFIIYTR